jgi:hypothetical protein
MSIDTSVRDYYVRRVAASESTGSENIGRADISITVRAYNVHGITVRYAESRRDGTYASLPTSHQSIYRDDEHWLHATRTDSRRCGRLAFTHPQGGPDDP